MKACNKKAERQPVNDTKKQETLKLKQKSRVISLSNLADDFINYSFNPKIDCFFSTILQYRTTDCFASTMKT